MKHHYIRALFAHLESVSLSQKEPLYGHTLPVHVSYEQHSPHSEKVNCFSFPPLFFSLFFPLLSCKGGKTEHQKAIEQEINPEQRKAYHTTHKNT